MNFNHRTDYWLIAKSLPNTISELNITYKKPDDYGLFNLFNYQIQSE